MSDMSKNRFLKKLYLNNNQIIQIQGIENNKNLEVRDKILFFMADWNVYLKN